MQKMTISQLLLTLDLGFFIFTRSQTSENTHTDYQATFEHWIQHRRRFSMFYQNHSPDVVRRGNGMEYYSHGFCSRSNEEKTIKVTLLGYKVMEEKTKFTVYKILVRRAPDESWHIFRRYTDFSRLHDKLREIFPVFKFVLPPKRWFKNFNSEFLEERQLGLQDFLQHLVAQKDMRNSEAVREFLCLDDPPTAFGDIRERWAFCESLEGTNCCLQRDLMDDRRETESLRNVLLHKELQISRPERTKNSELQFIRSHGACWCGSATDIPEKHSSGGPFQELH
ncbi:sorting nexin-16-like isoform X2 [Megalobrama amblycephala]|uniref:sorting nexin-16-like isoform X2 n=1 Tax=Megalobrama amblycephala TaxID=75352 RepID=UPI0020144DEB|nr:sorting nexin-16-like isoform X2 [Megalobrama amblycephala]